MSIQGKGIYAESLRNYFQTEEILTPSESVLLQVVVENDPAKVAVPAKYYSLSGKIAFNSAAYCVQEEGYVYSISNLFSITEPVVLRICCTKKRGLKNQIRALRSPHSVGLGRVQDRFVDSVMNYSCFLYIFAILLMRQDKVFVHCGIFENAGNAYVMCGTGGCGKTSTLLDALQRDGIKYLAEDFGILGKDGKAYYMPKKMAIYQSDAKYKNPDVIKGLKKLPLTYRAHWKFFELCKRNPRYRFAPEELLGKERVAKEGKLHKILYMSRVRQDMALTREDIDIDELCTKIRHASFRELKQLSEILNNIRAVGDARIRDSYPELTQLELRYEQLLKAILASRNIGWLQVPLKAKPRKIVDGVMGERSEKKDQKEDEKG